MTHDDHQDRLIDILLREELGGEAPPDLAAAILARVAPRRRLARRLRWLLVPLAAAAGFAIAVLCMQAFSGYPDPRAAGSYEVAGGGAVARGATLVTGAGPARLALGGYCRVEILPGSAVRIEGGERDERIALERGEVACDVTPSAGAFSVATPAGTAVAVGTRFSVRYTDRKGDGTMRSMLVKVVLGTVFVSGLAGNLQLCDGEEAAVADQGTVTGIFIEAGKEAAVVKADNERESRRYLLGDDLAAAVKAIRAPNLVKLEWRLDGERRRLVSIATILPAEKSGTTTGVVTAKRPQWLEVRPEGGPAQRYMPKWIGGMPADGGGLDKEMIKAIGERKVGDKVKVSWIYEERLRVTAIELIEAAKDEKAPEPEVKSGTVTGTITEKGETWIRVKPEGDQPSERYVPRWVGGAPPDGGFDKEMLKVIAGVNAGDNVEVKWVWEERPRVIELKVLAAAEEK